MTYTEPIMLNASSMTPEAISAMSHGLILVTGPDSAKNADTMQTIRAHLNNVSAERGSVVDIGKLKYPGNDYSVSYDELVSPEDKSKLNDDHYWDRLVNLSENMLFRESSHNTLILENIDDYFMPLAFNSSKTNFLVVVSVDAVSLDGAFGFLKDGREFSPSEFRLPDVIIETS